MPQNQFKGLRVSSVQKIYWWKGDIPNENLCRPPRGWRSKHIYIYLFSTGIHSSIVLLLHEHGGASRDQISRRAVEDGSEHRRGEEKRSLLLQGLVSSVQDWKHKVGAIFYFWLSFYTFARIFSSTFGCSIVYEMLPGYSTHIILKMDLHSPPRRGYAIMMIISVRCSNKFHTKNTERLEMRRCRSVSELICVRQPLVGQLRLLR